MVDAFIKYISAHVELSETDIDLIRALSVPRRLNKKQLFSQQGDICNHVAFIVKGLIRIYSVADDGTEHTICFFPEKWWAADWDSYDEQVPAVANLVALEDCELLVWKKADFDRILREIPGMSTYYKGFVSERMKANLARIHMYISQSSEQKYEYFIRKFPDLHARVPLHMIASYLGVTRETLSRVRSNYVHK